MNKLPVHIASVVALLVVVVVIVNQWSSPSERSPTERDAATRSDVEAARTGARVAAGETRDSQSPTESPPSTTFATEDADEVSGQSVSAPEDFGVLVERIDPLLRERNLIVRSPDLEQNGPSLEDVESRFSTEGVDADWSDSMEARILDQISQVTGLGLVALDAECRETICRVKLFYPTGTDALSSLDNLKPIARRIGFGDAVEVATIGEAGVPISLLYFLREAPP